MERKSPMLPKDAEGLREHIVSVASGAKLKLTKKELDELAPLPAKTSPKEGREKKEKENTASDTSKDDLKAIESD